MPQIVSRPAARHLTPLSLLAALLAGCGGTNSQPAPNPTPTPTGAGPAISGHAFAGTKPLIAATIQLYAAATTGNGSAPTTLSSAATSDATGSFTIPAGYTCPSAASQLYLVARGGSPVPTTANAAIALITPLGRCDAVTASTSYVINEATTAATAWALSQFLAPGANIGATATNATGLATAFAIALSLAGNTTGLSPGNSFPATGTSPAPRINALANLLNTCTTSATTCPKLFALTGMPTDTFGAVLNLVRNPGVNVTPLFLLSQTSTAFTPTLPSTPSDWTLPLTFSGGGMIEPGPLAVDTNGNIWVASYSGVVSKFDPLGAPAFPSGITGLGLSESYGLAIDPSNNVWITNESSPSTINSGYGTITVLSPAGQSLSGPAGFSAGGLNYPIAVAIDPNSTAWIIDYGNSHLTELSPSGQPLSGASGYFSSAFAFPVAIALDASHNAWVASSGGQNITRISANGQQTLDVTCCNTPSGLALDAAGNVWVANYLGDSVSEVNPTNTSSIPQYTAASLDHPQGIAVDGSGHIWIASFRGNSITELAGTINPPANSQAYPLLSPPAGWAPTPTSLQPFALAIDRSGNVWISNFANATLTELVGLATPVKTPLNALPQTP